MSDNNTQDKVNALLFGPNLPSAGLSVSCIGLDGMLKIISPFKTVKYAQLSAKLGGFEHDQLQLHWIGSDGDYTLIPASKAEQKRLVAQIPQGAVQGLTGWKTAARSQSAVWNTIVYGIGALAILFVVAIWQYDAVVGLAAKTVSIETENKMGDAVLAQLEADSSLLKTGAAVDFVKKIGNQLTAGSKYQYKWFVAQDDTVNAFAMPGGIVVVNSGLLKKADNPSEVAAVLAHEVQHVEQRHALKNMISSAGIATAVLLVLGDANAAMLIITHKLTSQFFTRHVEAEADQKGLELLKAKKMPAAGMASFFKKLAGEAKNQPNIPEWLSSHPDTKSRIAAAQRFALANPCKDCPALTWDKPAILKSVEIKELSDKPTAETTRL